MANSKISALVSASTPLVGTEVLPIVQSGATVKVANNDLRPKQIQSNATSGVLQIAGPAAGTTRTMTTPDANFTAARTDAAQSFTGDQTLSTGNLIQGTAAKGVNFTANTGAAGMTSQLLNWYEEGTFTITVSGSTSGSGTVSGVANYTRIGRIVTINVAISNVTFPTYVGNLRIALPFTSKNDTDGQFFGAPAYFYPLANWTTGAAFAGWIPRIGANDPYVTFQLQQVNGDRQTLATAANTTTSNTAGLYLSFSITYIV